MRFKNLLLFLPFLLSILSCGKEETIPEPTPEPEKIHQGGLYIDSQAKLESIGNANFTKINGNVILIGNNITDVSSFGSLKYIYGNLQILGTQLVNIDALAKVNVPEGSHVTVVNNQKLKNLNGLAGIDVALTVLEIRDNKMLENIDGVRNVKAATHMLTISDTDNMLNLNGLANVSGSVRFLSIRSNNSLTDISALSKITQVTDLIFARNSQLTTLNGFTNLKEIKNLVLDANNKLEDVSGFSELETCQQLTIQNNTSLKHLNGFLKLRKVDDYKMKITGNTSLRDFCGLQPVAQIGNIGYEIRNNFYNPTKDQIKEGQCSI
jgi:hypothetical protein